ncbi:MAG: hypothetical protein KGI29_10135, partial [Pseudomonadota bacterium]|nr:hypothetical protein [Pseudomonadota bacterium]
MANANQIITIITKSSGQITAAIANSSNQIVAAIANSNPFWQQVLAGSIGAFAGAGAAFLFNWRNELRKIRHEQNTAINETIHLFSLNIMMLLNFKQQFLEKFSNELNIIAGHAGNYHSKLPGEILEKLAQQWETKHKPMILKCMKEYENDRDYARLNSLMIKWELVKYAKVDLKQIYFVTEGMPDILQFALYATQQIELFSDLLKQRNEFWKEKISILSGDQLWEPTPDFMCCLYEFICMRQNLRVYLDQAVVMMRATNICLA